MKEKLLSFCLLLLTFILVAVAEAAYPGDPVSDLEWPYSSENSVASIQLRFNNGRAAENSQLGTNVPMMQLPSQAEWDAMGAGQKVLWLINRERVDRELLPLHGIEPRVTAVASYYADYLMVNDVFGHFEDGKDPWQRMNSDPVINSCHDFLGIGENLSVLWGGWSVPVERAVYSWMYDDKGSNWGHRHAILWYPYANNSGSETTEGFLGVGVAVGTHEGYSNSTIVVMNVFDPCSSWDYSSPPAKGDVTGNGDVDLADAVTALRLVCGFEVVVEKDGDANSDGIIGLAEAIYVLQLIAGEELP